eukprot:TRINITY_DN18870_c0_g1_i1.p1 TRINITY_DN18870_c0_g1~~TRINITY_DN18870_c0_g1_i1.p1  ORF type:complete len:773 (+),score=143.70 TRINITY_DN18870_c0_g1_i1:297-2321(+)
MAGDDTRRHKCMRVKACAVPSPRLKDTTVEAATSGSRVPPRLGRVGVDTNKVIIQKNTMVEAVAINMLKAHRQDQWRRRRLVAPLINACEQKPSSGEHSRTDWSDATRKPIMKNKLWWIPRRKRNRLVHSQNGNTPEAQQQQQHMEEQPAQQDGKAAGQNGNRMEQPGGSEDAAGQMAPPAAQTQAAVQTNSTADVESLVEDSQRVTADAGEAEPRGDKVAAQAGGPAGQMTGAAADEQQKIGRTQQSASSSAGPADLEDQRRAAHKARIIKAIEKAKTVEEVLRLETVLRKGPIPKDLREEGDGSSLCDDSFADEIGGKDSMTSQEAAEEDGADQKMQTPPFAEGILVADRVKTLLTTERPQAPEDQDAKQMDTDEEDATDMDAATAAEVISNRVTEVAAANRKEAEKIDDAKYIVQVDGYDYCKLCDCWADEAHRNGQRHKKRMKYPEWYMEEGDEGGQKKPTSQESRQKNCTRAAGAAGHGVKPVTKAAAKRPRGPWPKALPGDKKAKKAEGSADVVVVSDDKEPPRTAKVPQPSRKIDKREEEDGGGREPGPRPPHGPPPGHLKRRRENRHGSEQEAEEGERLPPWRRKDEKPKAAIAEEKELEGVIEEIKPNGFGFISQWPKKKGQPDVYFHSKYCISEFESLRIGDWVTYTKRRDDDGRWVAKGVLRQ